MGDIKIDKTKAKIALEKITTPLEENVNNSDTYLYSSFDKFARILQSSFFINVNA